jgi:hypothetical protein
MRYRTVPRQLSFWSVFKKTPFNKDQLLLERLGLEDPAEFSRKAQQIHGIRRSGKTTVLLLQAVQMANAGEKVSIHVTTRREAQRIAYILQDWREQVSIKTDNILLFDIVNSGIPISRTSLHLYDHTWHEHFSMTSNGTKKAETTNSYYSTNREDNSST